MDGDKPFANLKISLERNSKFCSSIFPLDVSKVSFKELKWSRNLIPLHFDEFDLKDCLGNENRTFGTEYSS